MISCSLCLLVSAPHGGNEGAHLVGILDARPRLDTAGDVDREWLYGSNAASDIGRGQPSRQQQRSGKLGHGAPIESLAASTQAAGDMAVEQQARRICIASRFAAQ